MLQIKSKKSVQPGCPGVLLGQSTSCLSVSWSLSVHWKKLSEDSDQNGSTVSHSVEAQYDMITPEACFVLLWRHEDCPQT